LAGTGQGITAAGAPLRTLVARDFDPTRPYWFGGTDATEDPVLRALLDDYAQRLLAAGWEEASRVAWGFDRLPGGLPFDRALRRVLVDAERRGVEIADPFSREGAEQLLAEAARPAARGAAWGVNRYLHELWEARPDLSRAFPDLDTADGERYAAWATANGESEGLPAALVPPRGDEPPAFGVNIAGYLSSTLGTAEAARLYIEALRAVGVPMRMESLVPPRPAAARRTASTPPSAPVRRDLDAPGEYGLNLVTVNPIQLPQFVRVIGEDFFAGRPTVGIWAWETSVIPSTWEPAFEWVDEIWTHSSYSASLIAPRSPVPVIALPPPVIAPEPSSEPLQLDLPDGFVFLFAFDFLSTVERKNPLGLVEAFTRAFRPNEGPQLVLKAFNGDYKPQHVAELRYAARGRDDIQIVDRWVSDAQRRALNARADCYVSLHRSEGFGLTMAEAMAMGKPVIATGYSGNLDFMDPSTAYLVGHSLTTVGPGVDIYPADGVWAEPDLDHAAELMRRVVAEPEGAAERGARAREAILRRFSPEATGALARSRLERLAQRPSRRVPEGVPHPAEALQLAAQKATYDPLSGVASSHPKDLAKRAALQAMRPYTYHQRELNDLLVDSLRELHATVERLEGMVVVQRRRLRRAEWRVRALESRFAERED
jgi:glycosyltransferase involved in cell wall biosynthesis